MNSMEYNAELALSLSNYSVIIALRELSRGDATGVASLHIQTISMIPLNRTDCI